MNDYTDLLFLLGAMLIFSVMSSTASRQMQQTSNTSIDSDIEYEAIALAQGIIDEAKWTSTAAELQNLADQYNGQTETVYMGSSNQYQIAYQIGIKLNDETFPGASTGISSKRITVSVASDYLPDSSYVKLEFIKSFVN